MRDLLDASLIDHFLGSICPKLSNEIRHNPASLRG